MSTRIFYVEDDDTLSFITQDQLEANGFDVTHIADGTEAIERFDAEKYDLAVLDIMLPSADGFAIAREIRKSSADIPILFLSAKSLEEDRLKGFEIGADDYLTKPFSMDELIMKIKVFLKRNKINQFSTIKTLQIGCFELNTNNYTLKTKDFKKELTQKEVDLFQMFIENQNQTIKREDILIRLWGKNDYFLGRSLDVFVSRLRKYIAIDTSLKIHTVRGVGFRLETNLSD